MRVLHISHSGIPDARVEKNAFTMKKKGHELLFMSGIQSEVVPPFTSVSRAFYKNDALMAFGKMGWPRKIRHIDPDVIHAHDIFACRMTFGLGYPVIYDDHEWWTRNFPIWFGLRAPYAKLLSLPALISMRKWEHRAVTSYPTLTVHENIAESHRREYGGWVRTTNNYPSLPSVTSIPSNNDRNGAVYLGSDARKKKRPSYRSMDGLPKSVVFDRLFGLTYRDMLVRLTEYKVGLIPWNCHQLHHYASPAKAYDYLHAGLHVISPRTMSVLNGIPFVHFFDSLDEIPAIIEDIEHDDTSPEKIIEHARKHHTWESQERKVHAAYAQALRRQND